MHILIFNNKSNFKAINLKNYVYQLALFYTKFQYFYLPIKIWESDVGVKT